MLEGSITHRLKQPLQKKKVDGACSKIWTRSTFESSMGIGVPSSGIGVFNVNVVPPNLAVSSFRRAERVDALLYVNVAITSSAYLLRTSLLSTVLSSKPRQRFGVIEHIFS